MTSASVLRRDIERCELPHKAFQELISHLDRLIDDACEGYEARIEWVVGPSRVGKTMLIKALSRTHPEEKVGAKRKIPVLVVKVPSTISPKLLPVSVLRALGVAVPARGASVGVMMERMFDQLRLAGTRVIIFEEASHIVEPGARVIPRTAGDWFKDVADELNLLLILVGVPRLERLFKSNEQLLYRASERLEFRPYDIRIKEEQAAFASCVRSYYDMFETRGWTFTFSFKLLAAHCYLLSGGLVGMLSRFMQQLAARAAVLESRTIDVEDCRAAAQTMNDPLGSRVSAFQISNASLTALSLPELYAAHVRILNVNGMAPRSIPSVQRKSP